MVSSNLTGASESNEAAPQSRHTRAAISLPNERMRPGRPTEELCNHKFPSGNLGTPRTTCVIDQQRGKETALLPRGWNQGLDFQMHMEWASSFIPA
ncbi:unnamed protein product [Pleuronectes platessa]|uniref:Uncharacterized protein n=1 Tax=Pleuronectes platessa TaxID=8262 RepID=A0A9N7UHR8_PLEPL|nr:unnamed protein product [Pleuronectes platessa]